jgi:hypothetical protein
MGRISPARVMQAVGAFAWLLVGAMARPAAAQEPVLTVPARSFADVVSIEETDQPPAQPIDLSTFGDLTFTPRVMLHETRDFSLTSELAVTVPTGNQPLTGKTTLTPAVAFWNNFAGR